MSKITRRDVITFALLLLALNIFQAFRLKEISSKTENTSNPNSDQAGGGKEISTASAFQLINDYRDLHTSEKDKTIYKTTGWQISKNAINNIFHNTEINALYFDLVNHEGTLKLIIQGRQSEKTEIDATIGNSIFIVQSMCPADCSTYGK